MKNPFKTQPVYRERAVAIRDVQTTSLPPERVALTKVLDEVNEYYAGVQSQRGASGNLANGLSGMGGVSDKAQFFQFLPFWLNSKQYIENVTINSWVADRFVRMPIDDMFTRPRTYDDPAFTDEAERLKLDTKAASAMRLGRKLGTGLLWVVSKESLPEEPLEINRIRPTDVTNLIVVDRNDASVEGYNRDIFSEGFGEPLFYRIQVHNSGSFLVHASRIYRFDGLKADSDNGWSAYTKDWGISNLAHAMNEIFNDASVVQGITHLVQEASIPVQKVDGLSEILCNGALPDEQSVESRMSDVNMLKSIYHTLFMDSKDDFSREAVNFANVPDLMEKFSERLAMAAGVSATRFLNQSPDGQNSTGEGDMRNDNRTTSARQDHMLKPFYDWVDPIIAKSAGTVEPDYEFPQLFEPTDEEIAKTVDKRADTVEKMTTAAVMDENEGREYLRTGALPEGTIEIEEVDSDETAALVAAAMKQTPDEMGIEG